MSRMGWAMLVAFTVLARSTALGAGEQEDKWAEAMTAFERQDGEAAPRPGGFVFVGSSSIRLWDLQQAFPGLPALNRGFGGSQIVDAVRHVDLLVIRHRPRTVILYAGDNDIAGGKTPAVVARDFAAFVQKVHAALPETRIAFIAIKPSIQRWKLIGQVREANALVRDLCDRDDRLGFVDVDRPMIGWDGTPRADLFVEDGLHLSPRGYDLWTILARPFLE